MMEVEMYRFQFALIVLNNIISFIFTSTRAVDPSDESFIFVYSLQLQINYITAVSLAITLSHPPATLVTHAAQFAGHIIQTTITEVQQALRRHQLRNVLRREQRTRHTQPRPVPPPRTPEHRQQGEGTQRPEGGEADEAVEGLFGGDRE